MKNELKSLIRLAKYAGGRLDLVQAGGGNASVKHTETKMLATQAWGCTLSDTEENQGYVCVDTKKICDVLANESVLNAPTLTEKNKIANEFVRDANDMENVKPTAEVFLHALLPFKYALHLHPIIVNSILVQNNAKELITQLLPDAGFVEYGTPGLEVSIMFKDYIDSLQLNNKTVPKLIFMKNHGLMVGADSIDEIINMVETMLDTIEAYYNVNNEKYRNASKIANLFDEHYEGYCVAYLSRDITINEIYKNNQTAFLSNPIYPDQFIYNGLTPLILRTCSDEELQAYKQMYSALPKVVVYKDAIYFIAKNISFAKEMEDVFNSHLLILSGIANNASIDFLVKSQIDKIRF